LTWLISSPIILDLVHVKALFKLSWTSHYILSIIVTVYILTNSKLCRIQSNMSTDEVFTNLDTGVLHNSDWERRWDIEDTPWHNSTHEPWVSLQ